MIIAQHIHILKKDIQALMNLLKEKGYQIENALYELDPCIAFDVFRKGYFFRLKCQSEGDITGISAGDIIDAFSLLEDIYPLVQKGSFIFFVGHKHEDLFGYYVSSEGICEAVDIQVTAQRGKNC